MTKKAENIIKNKEELVLKKFTQQCKLLEDQELIIIDAQCIK